MTRRMSLAAVNLLLVAYLLVVIACSGPDIGQVSGRVTVNGKPLANAHIAFSNQKTGVSVNANLNDDGSYVIKTYEHNGLPPGEYHVAVKGGTFGRGDPILVGQAPSTTVRPSMPIPQKYSDIKTSGLSATVERGENQPFDFDLK